MLQLKERMRKYSIHLFNLYLFLLIDSCNTAKELPPDTSLKALLTTSRAVSDESSETQYIAIAFGAIGGVILLILVALGVLIQRHRKRNTEF